MVNELKIKKTLASIKNAIYRRLALVFENPSSSFQASLAKTVLE